MYKGITEKARELMASGEFDGVFAWCEGDFTYDTQPKYYKEIKTENIYTPFCGANLSKSLINFPFSEKRTAVLLKPCYSRAFKILTSTA